MSDILADYRIWKSQQEERIGTHSKRCHMWPRHERCMIHRLAAELEKSRRYRDLAEADLSIAMLAATRNGNPSACETVRLRLTDAEREAVEFFARLEVGANCNVKHAATLRGLLTRHFPVPENQPSQDNASEQHPNPDEVSVRPECAAWMTRPFYVDPAAGWSYGFPKLYDPAKDGDMTAWLIANGYPQYLADQNLPITFTSQIEQ